MGVRQEETRMGGSKLYVGNLSHSVTKEQLEELFSNYGEVRKVRLFTARDYGFVEMSTPSEAETAKEALNGSDFKGRTLIVDEGGLSRSQQRGGYQPRG